MSSKPIIILPHKNLRVRSQKVSIISDDIRQLASEMQTATLTWEEERPHEVGLALAAVQINSLVRVVVIRRDFNDKENRDFQVLINPVITKYEGSIEEDFEGCLSIKDIYGKVPRHSKVRVRALNIEGQEIRLKADGFLARVLQHEVDHTNGIVFLDHIKGHKEAFYELKKEGGLEKLDYDKEIANNSILW